MPRQTRETQARRSILIRLMLDLHALVRDSSFPHEEALVVVAVRLGQYDGRPMDVSDIAREVRLPMSTVSRHIVTLRKKGWLRSERSGRRSVQYLITPASEQAEVARFYREAEQIFRRAARDISRMETSAIDKG